MPSSLSDMCRRVIIQYLERYPPDAFGIIDETEWDAIVSLKYETSKPQKGKGGLDGTGRLHPALSGKFLSAVETYNEHLNASKVADTLVWKDIVEYQFKKGGLSRPRQLYAPWPVLVQQLQEAGQALQASLVLQDAANRAAALQAIHFLENEAPMDLTLLKESGIGKTVKKFLQKSTKLNFLDEPYAFCRGKDIRKTPRLTLQTILDHWMEMATHHGVKMIKQDDVDNDRAAFPSNKKIPAAAAASSKSNNQRHSDDKLDVDLSAARKCSSWRALYHTLKLHDEERKCRQGEKMRKRRQRLDSVRPKIVKVRHATKQQHDRMLNQQPQQRFKQEGNSKIQQLKMESCVTSTRRRPPPTADASRLRSSFGAAVAFASTCKPAKRKAATLITSATKTVSLAGGKRIKVPDINKTASLNVQKRLTMLKKGQSSFRG